MTKLEEFNVLLRQNGFNEVKAGTQTLFSIDCMSIEFSYHDELHDYEFDVYDGAGCFWSATGELEDIDKLIVELNKFRTYLVKLHNEIEEQFKKDAEEFNVLLRQNGFNEIFNIIGKQKIFEKDFVGINLTYFDVLYDSETGTTKPHGGFEIELYDALGVIVNVEGRIEDEGVNDLIHILVESRKKLLELHTNITKDLDAEEINQYVRKLSTYREEFLKKYL